MDVGAVTLMLILMFASVLAYRLPFLHNKKIAYFSLLQILYLIVLPGFIFVLAYSEMQTILQRPLAERIWFPDELLVNVILLASLYTYGGVAIHAVAKMFAYPDKLRFDKSEVGEMNRFLHLQFSHNLVYGSATVVLLGYSLLETNHLPVVSEIDMWSHVVKGLVLGACFLVALRDHTRSKDNYVGKLSDFKFWFTIIWIAFVLLWYTVKKNQVEVREYEILLPVMMALATGSGVSMVLVVKRLKWKSFGARLFGKRS